MAVRLALEFNATTLVSQIKEKEQVEKYMRVCLLVNEGFETAVTIAPSEPLLAEGAFLIMREQEAFERSVFLYQELRPVRRAWQYIQCNVETAHNRMRSYNRIAKGPNDNQGRKDKSVQVTLN